MNNEEITKVLHEVVRQQIELRDEFHKKKKDVWDKVSIASSFISGVVLAVLGIFFTHIYNQQQATLNRQQAEQNRQQVERDNTLKDHQVTLAEIQTVGTFMPYLSGQEENKKRAAILAISRMTNTTLAGEIAAIFQGTGAIQAMTTIASSGSQSDQRVANEALATIAAGSKAEERKAAVDALKMINNNPLDLQAPDKSVINVEVTSEGTLQMVSHSLNGKAGTGNSFSFTLDKANNDPAILVLVFVFSNAEGGVYKVRITGPGNTSSQYVVRQMDGVASTSVAYTFDIT